ncbi:Hypothetical protein NocV09_00103270 [Nannochloropsis oceanica]
MHDSQTSRGGVRWTGGGERHGKEAAQGRNERNMDIYYPKDNAVSHGKVHELLDPEALKRGEPLTEESIRWLLELHGEMFLIEQYYSTRTRLRRLALNGTPVAEFSDIEPMVDFQLGTTNIRMAFTIRATKGVVYELLVNGKRFEDLTQALPSPIASCAEGSGMTFGDPLMFQRLGILPPHVLQQQHQQQQQEQQQLFLKQAVEQQQYLLLLQQQQQQQQQKQQQEEEDAMALAHLNTSMGPSSVGHSSNFLLHSHPPSHPPHQHHRTASHNVLNTSLGPSSVGHSSTFLLHSHPPSHPHHQHHRTASHNVLADILASDLPILVTQHLHHSHSRNPSLTFSQYHHHRQLSLGAHSLQDDVFSALIAGVGAGGGGGREGEGSEGIHGATATAPATSSMHSWENLMLVGGEEGSEEGGGGSIFVTPGTTAATNTNNALLPLLSPAQHHNHLRQQQLLQQRQYQYYLQNQQQEHHQQHPPRALMPQQKVEEIKGESKVAINREQQQQHSRLTGKMLQHKLHRHLPQQQQQQQLYEGGMTIEPVSHGAGVLKGGREGGREGFSSDEEGERVNENGRGGRRRRGSSDLLCQENQQLQQQQLEIKTGKQCMDDGADEERREEDIVTTITSSATDAFHDDEPVQRPALKMAKTSPSLRQVPLSTLAGTHHRRRSSHGNLNSLKNTGRRAGGETTTTTEQHNSGGEGGLFAAAKRRLHGHLLAEEPSALQRSLSASDVMDRPPNLKIVVPAPPSSIGKTARASLLNHTLKIQMPGKKIRSRQGDV